MKLRNRLHVCSIASIANLHDTKDNQSILHDIMSGGTEAGPAAPLLAALIGITRARGRVTMDAVQKALKTSARQFEGHIMALMDLGYIRRSGDLYIVAPFRMSWGPHRHENRHLMPQPDRLSPWAKDIIRAWIERRPDSGEPFNVLHPRWVSERVAHAKVASCAPVHSDGAGEATLAQERPKRQNSTAKRGCTCKSGLSCATPIIKNVLQGIAGSEVKCRAVPSLRSGTVGSCRRNGPAVDLPRPVIQNESLPAAAGDPRPTMTSIELTEQSEVDETGVQVPAAACKPTKRATASRARRGEGVEASAPKPKRGRRTLAEREKAQPEDQRAERIWIAHRKSHEKWDENGVASPDGAFGMAGVGSRTHFFAAWRELAETDKDAAAELVEQTIEWRAKRGWRTQAAAYYLRDRSWTSLPKVLSFPKSRVPSAPMTTDDHWTQGVAAWIKAGNPVMIPGGHNPEDWALWPQDRRDLFVAAGRAVVSRDPAALDRLKRRSLLAWAAVAGQPVPATMDIGRLSEADRRALAVKGLVGAATRGSKIPFEPRKKHATLSPAELAAYCRDVGLI